MKPFVVRYKAGDEDMLCVGFIVTGGANGSPNTVHAVVVMQDGTFAWVPVGALRVEFGNQDWPLGPGDYAFSRARFEMQPEPA